MFNAHLDSICVALQAPDCAAAPVKGGLGLRLGWDSPEAHADPQSLRYLLDEWRTRIRQSLGHKTYWQVKGHG